jgi:ABC-type multidrug transport system fused ATPase/permease subunit
MRGRTVFVIAHRLSTVKHASKIVVLEKGNIVESGTHDELMNAEGLYKKLYLLQFRDSDSASG